MRPRLTRASALFFSALLTSSLAQSEARSEATAVSRSDVRAAETPPAAVANELPPRDSAPLPKLVLTPQAIVDSALVRGRPARAAEFEAQRSFLGLEQARSIFDLNFRANVGYEIDRAQALNGLANPENRTLTYGAELAKRLQTGTQFTLNYVSTDQSSVLNDFLRQLRDPNASSDIITLTLRQALLRNYLGVGDRLQIETAESRINAALENREEQLENTLLEAMELFWAAYVAQQQLKQNIAAREKYEQLVKNVRRKSGFNLATPGELPRLEAEREATDQRVKASAAGYLNAVDALLTAAQLPNAGDYEFQTPNELPPVPQLAAKKVDDLRVIRVARVNFENAERDLRFAKVAGLPQLDLIATARSTGVDRDRTQALAEMTAGTRPTYFVGVEVQAPLDSALVRGQLADRRVAVDQSRTLLEIARDQARNQLAALERTMTANYAIAKQAVEIVEHRQKVVREVEVSYRQGRQPLLELIRAFNELFDAQLAKERAIGEYHISLNRLAAARDELVTQSPNAPVRPR